MNPNDSGTGDGLSASAGSSYVGGWIWLTLFVVILGSLAYAIALATTLPARLVASRADLPEAIIDVSGTLWNGQAILEGGYEATWDFAGPRSLLNLALDLDWTLTGPDSRLTGAASLRQGSATLTADGRAGWGLVALAAPGLSVSCEGSLAVALEEIVIESDYLGAKGEVTSGPSTCVDTSADAPAPIDVPALTGVASMDAEGSSLTVAETANPSIPLAEIGVAARVLAVTIHPEGARLTGSLPTSGPITLEYPF